MTEAPGNDTRLSRLAEVKHRQQSVLNFSAENPPTIHSRGLVEYAGFGQSVKIAVVCFTGRAATPSDPEGGMHLTAAHAAMHGCQTIVASAHSRSRKRARKWLLGFGKKTSIVILGHSHGGDHASTLAAEFYARAGREVSTLYTIDPVDSPTPFALKKIRKRRSVKRHINFFQRNAPWYGGSMKKADENYDVSDPHKWPGWSSLLRNKTTDSAKITHATIDEDLFLNGSLSAFTP